MRLTREVVEPLMRHRASLRSDWSEPAGVVEMAERHRFLPLFADLGGVVGVTADGDVVEMGWDDDAPRPVASRRMRDFALLQGVKRYPELAAIIPKRPIDARDCESCGGTGVLAHNGEPLRVMCRCGGFGWIPAEWESSR